MWSSFSINAIRYVTYLSWPVLDSTLNTPPFGQPCVFGAFPPCPDRELTRGTTPAAAAQPSPLLPLTAGQHVPPQPPSREGGAFAGAKAGRGTDRACPQGRGCAATCRPPRGPAARPGERARRGTAWRAAAGPADPAGEPRLGWAGRAGGCRPSWLAIAVAPCPGHFRRFPA